MTYLPLFILNALIWGTTWIAIKYQVEVVSPIWSVVYRFGFACALLVLYCLIKRRSLVFSRSAHLIMAAQGLLLFCLNYILYYIGSHYLITGLVALLSAITIFFNIFNARLLFKIPIAQRVLLGATVGLIGLTIVFSAQIAQMYHQNQQLHSILIGIICCILGALSASFGNMTAIKLHNKQIPMLESATISMMYGTFYSTVIALMMHEPIQFSLNVSYLISLIYLIIFGTIIAFGCYLTLLVMIGPARAAYISIITPIIAIVISTFFEGFVWNYHTITGITLIVCGNILVLNKRNASVKGTFASK